eukprot:m.188750 g.188750  ORF g.188750 m.188750 type:complete len:720 (-) comp10032_c1_seq1:1216-3375(-)
MTSAAQHPAILPPADMDLLPGLKALCPDIAEAFTLEVVAQGSWWKMQHIYDATSVDNMAICYINNKQLAGHVYFKLHPAVVQSAGYASGGGAGDTGLQAFYAKALQLDDAEFAEFHTIDFNEVSVVDKIFGRRCFMRPSYSGLEAAINKIFEVAADERRCALVLGNPGIGKTYFGLYLLLRAIRAKRTVVYYNVVIRPNAAFLFTASGEALALKPSDERIEAALHLSSTLYIVDSFPPPIYDCCTVLITSPNRSIFKDFNKSAPGMGVEALYMPVWSLDELKLLRDAIRPNLDDADITALFEHWGGIARAVVENAKRLIRFLGQPRNPLETAINTCSVKQTLEALGNQSEHAEDISHKLIHAQCTTDFLLAGYEFASEYVRVRVLDRLARKERFALLRFAALRGDSFSAALRSHVFEFMAHERLAAGGEFACKPLAGPTPVLSTITIPRSVVMHRSTPLMLDELASTSATPTYFWPWQRNFAAVDSIRVVVGERPMLFQMTVGSCHPVKGMALKKLLDMIGEVRGLYFVVPADRFEAFRSQQYVIESGDPLTHIPIAVQEVQQFAICLDLWEMYQQEQRSVQPTEALPSSQAAAATVPPAIPSSAVVTPVGAAAMHSRRREREDEQGSRKKAKMSGKHIAQHDQGGQARLHHRCSHALGQDHRQDFPPGPPDRRAAAHRQVQATQATPALQATQLQDDQQHSSQGAAVGQRRRQCIRAL